MKTVTAVLVPALLTLLASPAPASRPEQVVLAHEETGGLREPMRGHWTAPKKAATRKNPVRAGGASLERGKKLYEANCAACHGATGRGDGPAGAALTPKPSDLREMAGEHPAGDLAWKIANGRGSMPAWKGALSERQIWDLVNYLKSLRGDGGRSGTSK